MSFSAGHYTGIIEFGAVINGFSGMRIPLQNVKANVNLLTWIVQWLAPTPTASLNVEDFLTIALTVRPSRKVSF